MRPSTFCSEICTGPRTWTVMTDRPSGMTSKPGKFTTGGPEGLPVALVLPPFASFVPPPVVESLGTSDASVASFPEPDDLQPTAVRAIPRIVRAPARGAQEPKATSTAAQRGRALGATATGRVEREPDTRRLQHAG